MEASMVGVTFVREVRVNYKGRGFKIGGVIRASFDAACVIRKLLPDNSREHFITLFLNGAHEVVAYAITSTGLANSTQVHPREVFQPAIISGAISIIVSHNHPSGSCDPSEEDGIVTKNLVEAGKIVGIKVLDHVVLGHTDHYSFADHCAI